MTPGKSLATKFETPDESTGFLLWQVTNRWQAAQRVALRSFELTHVQFVLLASLTSLGRDGPVTQRHLATQAATDEMMTSQVVRALEQRGLVERARHPSDGRARALTVTPAGRALANRAVVAVEACDDDFFGSLGSAKPELTALLRRLSGRAAARSRPVFP